MANELRPTAKSEEPTGGLQITLWTRRPVCGRRAVAINRLSELGAAGTIDDFEVETWPDEVMISGSNEHSDLLATIERFEQWAAEQGVSLRPPFELRTVGSLVGESREVLATPMLLAVVHDDGGLAGVYPCTDGDRTWAVTELFDALAAGKGLPLDRD